MKPTPVFLVTGFLGSGKTTLLNAVLRSPGFANTAVIVNEFGDIGLDHLLVAQSQDNVVLLDAGCLCCTVADSLHETLADLNARKVRGDVPPFARVIIETTGLADPAPIVNTLLGNRLVTDHYLLDAVIVTVDSRHGLSELDNHAEVAKQIAMADRLVVTKLDLGPLPDALEARLTRLNPAATLLDSRDIDTPAAAFAPSERHRIPGQLSEAGPHHHSRDVNRHDERIRAHGFVLAGAVSWSGIAAWWQLLTQTLGDRLLRMKGIVQIADAGEIVFLQGVQRVFHRPERLEGWPDADHRSRLVCITRDVDEAQLRMTLDALALPAGSDPHAFAFPTAT